MLGGKGYRTGVSLCWVGTFFLFNREERQGHEERQRVISRKNMYSSFVSFAVPPFFLPRRARRARRKARILQEGTGHGLPVHLRIQLQESDIRVILFVNFGFHRSMKTGTPTCVQFVKCIA
jgi:hypothetical protein